MKCRCRMIIFLAIDFVFISKVNCTISLKPSASSPESVQRAFVCVGSVRCRSSRRASGRESRKTLFFGFLFRIIFRTKAKRNVRRTNISVPMRCNCSHSVRRRCKSSAVSHFGAKQEHNAQFHYAMLQRMEF